MSCITAALNDPGRSNIGDPRRGTYAVSFTGKTLNDLGEITGSLETIGVTWQTNNSHSGNKVFLAVYAFDDQRKLLAASGPGLEIDRLSALEVLVHARGPIPDDLVRKIRVSVARGKSYAYVADRLNELGIVTGMGGHKWTTKKVRAVDRNG